MELACLRVAAHHVCVARVACSPSLWSRGKIERILGENMMLRKPQPAKVAGSGALPWDAPGFLPCKHFGSNVK